MTSARRDPRPAIPPVDPVRKFEHTHGSLNKIALDVAASVRAAQQGPTPETWSQLRARLKALHDELLVHFADEEEALFPFVRAVVPKKTAAVEGLEAAHDTICGSIVRMVHLAAGEPEVAKLAALHARFETAYAKHSAEEAKLFDGLDGLLDEAQRHELAERLRGL